MTVCNPAQVAVPAYRRRTFRAIATLAPPPDVGQCLARCLRESTEDFRYRSVHGTTVDAYAAQHPGVPSPQTTRSVAIHLIGLYLTLERDLPPDRSAKEKQRAANYKAGLRVARPAGFTRSSYRARRAPGRDASRTRGARRTLGEGRPGKPGHWLTKRSGTGRTSIQSGAP